MAYNLQTVFTVRDNASSKIKQITKHIARLDSTMEQLSTRFNQTYSDLNRLNSGFNNVTKSVKLLQTQINQLNGGINHLNGGVNNNTKIINHNTTVIQNNSSTINRNTSNISNNTTNLTRNNNVRNTWISTIGRENGALKGLSSTLGMLGGAYAIAAGGSKLFNSTIGAAARFEQSSTVLASMMNDAEKYKQYMQMIDTIAIDSPLLNSADMVAGSKGLLTMTKDMDLLESSWKTISKLTALNPLQGVDGAVYSLKALQSGDVESIVDRYDMSRANINPLKGLSFEDQIKGLDKVLEKMNVTDQLVEDMSKTTLGQYNSTIERISTFLRDVGEESNTSLGKFLTRLNKGIEKLDVKSLSNKLGDMLNNATNKAIALAGWMWKWKEPLSYAAGALAAVGTAFVGVGIIAALASPVSLIAAGIAGAAVGMKALYDNSETVRGAIDSVITKVGRLWGAFKTGGVNGLLDAILPKDAATKVQHIIGNIRGQISTLKHAFKTGGIGGVVDVILGEGTFEGVTAKFNEIKSFILAKIAEMQPGFETLKGVFSSVWSTISSVFSTVWTGVLQPGLANLWDALQILGNVAAIVFNNVVVPGLKFAAAVFSALWSVAGPILSLLGAALRVSFAVLKWVWDTILTPLVAFITTGVKNAFDAFTEAVNIVGGAFDWVGGIIDTVAEKISGFVKKIKDVKLPDWVTKGVNATVKFVGGALDKFNSAVDGSHYHGLREVGKNGYRSILHRGETVLPRQEAEFYRSIVSPGKSLADVWGSPGSVERNSSMSGVADVSFERSSAGIVNHNTANTYNTVAAKQGKEQPTQSQRSISIAKLADQIVVREDADIEKIAYDLAKYIEREALQIG